MNTRSKLTADQCAELRKELVPNGLPVRFQIEGRTLNIESGELQTKGINVIYQIVYWKFTKETSLKIAKWLNCKTVFSET